MGEDRAWLQEKLLLVAGLIESDPQTYVLERQPSWDEGIDCDNINARARSAGMIGPDEFIIEPGEDPSTDPGTPRPTRWIKFYNPVKAKPIIRIVVKESSGFPGKVTKGHADRIAAYLRAWATRTAESNSTQSSAGHGVSRQPPRFDPTSLAANGRAARDLTHNLREVLGWFDNLRSVDRDEPPEPAPGWWDGYVMHPRWKADGGSEVPSPADRVRWASAETLRTIDGVAGLWDSLCGVIPFTATERRKSDAAKESLRNLRGILAPAQQTMGMRIGAIPARWHLDAPIPEVWEEEPESDAERAVLDEATNAAFDIATKKGDTKVAAQKRLERLNAKRQRLAREREKRNAAARENARREGLVTADQRAELAAARSWWEEQVERWRLGELDVRELLGTLTSPRDESVAPPAPRVSGPGDLSPWDAAARYVAEAEQRSERLGGAIGRLSVYLDVARGILSCYLDGLADDPASVGAARARTQILVKSELGKLRTAAEYSVRAEVRPRVSAALGEVETAAWSLMDSLDGLARGDLIEGRQMLRGPWTEANTVLNDAAERASWLCHNDVDLGAIEPPDEPQETETSPEPVAKKRRPLDLSKCKPPVRPTRPISVGGAAKEEWFGVGVGKKSIRGGIESGYYRVEKRSKYLLLFDLDQVATAKQSDAAPD